MLQNTRVDNNIFYVYIKNNLLYHEFFFKFYCSEKKRNTIKEYV